MQQTPMLCCSLLAAYKQINQDTCSTEIRHHPGLFPACVRLLCQTSPTFCFLLSNGDSCLHSHLFLSTCDVLNTPPFLLPAPCSVHHLSLPPPLSSMLRLPLCWLQLETRSPLLFPGSRPLSLFPGPTL